MTVARFISRLASFRRLQLRLRWGVGLGCALIVAELLAGFSVPALGVWGALAVFAACFALGCVGERDLVAGPTDLVRHVDRRRALEDRLSTALELEAKRPRPAFADLAIREGVRQVGSLEGPLLARARFCAPLGMALLLALMVPRIEPLSGAGPRLPLPSEGLGLPSGALGSGKARPPEGSSSPPIPPEPIDLDDAGRTPRFVDPRQREGETHEKEVPTRELPTRPLNARELQESDSPPSKEQLAHAEAAAEELLRRQGVSERRREVVRRYFDSLRER